jgi:hypothetical protein
MSDNKTEEKYKKLFGYMNSVPPPKGFEGRVLSAIAGEESRFARIKKWAFGGSSLASFGLSVWAVIYLAGSIKQSGFGQYLSLIFSENGAVLAYWKELSLSLAESLPIFGVIMFLATVGLFIWSITKINYKKYELQF